jgi:hypothetical protein
MRGGAGKRTLLSPPGETTVDDPLVALQNFVRADSESFGDARAKRLQEDVRSLRQTQYGFYALRILEVDCYRTAAAFPKVVRTRYRGFWYVAEAVDADHLGAHVGQLERCEGQGAHAG